MKRAILALVLASCGPPPACVENSVDCYGRCLSVCYHGEVYRVTCPPCGERLHAETAVNACDIPPICAPPSS